MLAAFRSRRAIALLAAVALGAGGVALAQINGSDRGIPPIDSTSNYEVMGVTVDVSAKSAEAARMGGWREAQRRGWRMLWARIHGSTPDQAPRLPDSTLDGIVSGIVVENEQIGQTRYIARLGVLFDRGRTGGYLGAHGAVMRSAPMLVIPVEITGSVAQSFEVRTDWQRAWARFRAGASPIDYVRPVGNGADPLLLNAAQAGRRGRGWWRMLLDQYGAADILSPQVRLVRSGPGGPVTGYFTALHGPDGEVLGTAALRVPTSEGIPRLLDAGIARLDAIYAAALADGRLLPDPSLSAVEEPEVAAVPEIGLGDDQAIVDDLANAPTTELSIQIDTPDAAAITASEAALRGVAGVRGAQVSSLAIGGVSVFRVQAAGDPAQIAAALSAAGWQVSGSGTTLRLRRAAPQPAPANPAPAAGSTPAPAAATP